MKHWPRILLACLLLLVVAWLLLPHFHPTRAYTFTRGDWTGHCWILHKDGHDYPIQIEGKNSDSEAWMSFDALDYDLVQFNRERFVLVGELERFPTGKLGIYLGGQSDLFQTLVGYGSWLKGRSPDTDDMPAYHFRLRHWYLKPPFQKITQKKGILDDVPLKYKTLTKLQREHFDENFLKRFPSFNPHRYESP
ncbi:hypothetical protein [Armatimonas sp.]|uniref:hypothetical protein n=1 Tax=Armatimonas sp. TaxID=1872638 RepID=UPI00286C5D90|nr:hypothetical protein [Armatimonas sp.]